MSYIMFLKLNSLRVNSKESLTLGFQESSQNFMYTANVYPLP